MGYYMVKKRALLLVLVLLVGLLAAGCGKDEESAEEEVFGLNIDTITLDGDAYTSAELAANKMTVFNVWATWCPPCVAELPHLQQISEDFQDEGVAIVGVLQDGVTELGEQDADAIVSANTLLKEAGVAYPVILPDATLQQIFIRTMQYFPTTFFVDNAGNVIKKVEGARDYEEWSKLVREILEETNG